MTKYAMTPAMIAAPPRPPTTPPTMAPVLLFLPDDEAADIGVEEGARGATAPLPVAVGRGEEKPIDGVAEGMAEDSGGS